MGGIAGPRSLRQLLDAARQTAGMAGARAEHLAKLATPALTPGLRALLGPNK